MHALFFSPRIGANCRKELHRNIRTAQQARKLFVVLFSHESQLEKACLDSVLVCRFWGYNELDQLPIWRLTKNWSPVISNSKEDEVLDIWCSMMHWYLNVDGYFLFIEDFNTILFSSSHWWMRPNPCAKPGNPETLGGVERWEPWVYRVSVAVENFFSQLRKGEQKGVK